MSPKFCAICHLHQCCLDQRDIRFDFFLSYRAMFRCCMNTYQLQLQYRLGILLRSGLEMYNMILHIHTCLDMLYLGRVHHKRPLIWLYLSVNRSNCFSLRFINNQLFVNITHSSPIISCGKSTAFVRPKPINRLKALIFRPKIENRISDHVLSVTVVLKQCSRTPAVWQLNLKSSFLASFFTFESDNSWWV